MTTKFFHPTKISTTIPLRQAPTVVLCPQCGSVTKKTKSETLKAQVFKEHLSQIDLERDWYFCPGERCDVVYCSPGFSRLVRTNEIKSRVTLKDEHPTTPLCYCFTITKADVLAEAQVAGGTRVFARIQEHRARKNSFCAKANPKGHCCTEDIALWLQRQGIANLS
ncbi:MAG: hypothetical protein K6347_04045 [Campylobacterales bacterium]